MPGHGWVTPNANGMQARCGGIGLCPVCQQEYRDKYGHDYAGKIREEITPELTKDYIWNYQVTDKNGTGPVTVCKAASIVEAIEYIISSNDRYKLHEIGTSITIVCKG